MLGDCPFSVVGVNYVSLLPCAGFLSKFFDDLRYISL